LIGSQALQNDFDAFSRVFVLIGFDGLAERAAIERAALAPILHKTGVEARLDVLLDPAVDDPSAIRRRSPQASLRVGQLTLSPVVSEVEPSCASAWRRVAARVIGAAIRIITGVT